MSLHRITVLLLMIPAMAAVAADAVRIAPTTSVAAGLQVDVPVTGALEQPGPARLVLRYNPSALRIVAARGAEGAALDCASIVLGVPAVMSATEATITLDCDRTVATAEGPFCTLTVEAMADARGPHTIEPVALFANNQPSTDAALVPGTVLVAGTGIYRDGAAEGITGNYPNPFSSQSRFEYRVAGTGTVSFTIRDARGRVMLVLDPVERTPGTYSLDLTAKTWEFSTGAYMLQMTTMTDSYLHPFVVVK